MISSSSNFFTPQDLPQVGDRVAYVISSGTRLVGYGWVIQEPVLYEDAAHIIVPIRLESEDHHRNVWLSSLRRAAV